MGLFDLFKKNTVNTAPENNMEKWILGTYAMWSVYYGGDWKYIAGSKKINGKNRRSMRIMLSRDWAINNKEELFNTAERLMQADKKDVAAWDLCRGCQIIGMGFIGEWITREEMVQHSLPICRKMQSMFYSWDELYDSYLKGFRDWRNFVGSGAENAIRARENICRELKESPDGPWTIPWYEIF